MRPIDLVAYKELQSHAVNTLPISFSCFLLVHAMPTSEVGIACSLILCLLRHKYEPGASHFNKKGVCLHHELIKSRSF